jgi:hypothetical protein
MTFCGEDNGWRIDIMTNKKSEQETNEANLNLNKILEDGSVQSSQAGLPESVEANLKLQEKMMSDNQNDEGQPPLYLNNNNIPAIKINEKVDE